MHEYETRIYDTSSKYNQLKYIFSHIYVSPYHKFMINRVD